MKAEALRLALRPRPPYEAIDLGVRLAQDAARATWRAWGPLALLLVAATSATFEVSPWWPPLLLGWFKPWLERPLLHLYARHAFGEGTTFAQAWAARAEAPWGPMLAALTWRRLSPWRAFVAPVVQLEGQHGKALARRMAQVASGQRGHAFAAQMLFGLVEGLLATGAFVGIVALTPSLTMSDVTGFQPTHPTLGAALMVGCYAAAVLAVTPFHVAAGFAMYLNRRADLEAWDVEQDLREAFAAASPEDAA